MRYARLTQRIAGEGSAAWDTHYRALAMKARGEDVLLLSVGDPDFDTPAPIVAAAVESLQAGRTHYAEARGKKELRERIAAWHNRRSGQAVDAEQVVVQAGAQCALFSVAQCLLDPGDEVIVPEPMYVTYEAVFHATGARIVPVPLRAEHGFRLRAEDVAHVITPRTRAIAINSPHNPSGAMLSRTCWDTIAWLCERHDLWLISDEVYSELSYESHHISPASLPGMAERTVTINSLSKSHAMTGWRLGWAIAPRELAAHLARLALAILYGCPEFIQDAACVALDQPMSELAAMRRAYRDRRDRVCRALTGRLGLRPIKPDAGMFVMVDIRPTGVSAKEFAEILLDRYGVAVLAGEAFGASAAGHIRVGLTIGGPELEEACARIAQCAADLFAPEMRLA